MAPLPQFLPRLKALAAQERTQKEFARKIGVTPSYASQLLQGTYNPSRELLDSIVAAYELDQEEWEVLAGFRPPPSLASELEVPGGTDALVETIIRKFIERGLVVAQSAPPVDLSQLSLGQHDSPQNRLRDTLNALYVKYTGLQWANVPHPQQNRHYTGGKVKTDREADQHIAAYLESLGKRNPDQPPPEELAEYEARLAEDA